MLATCLLFGCSSDASYPLVQGGSLNLTNPEKLIVINYWAVWCAPCRKEIPELNELASHYAETVTVVGVNFDGSQGQELLGEIEHQELEAIRNWSKNGAIIAMRGWTPWCDKIDKISSMYDFTLIKEPVIVQNISTPQLVEDCPPDVRYRRWHQLSSNFPDGTKLSKFVGKRPIDIYEYFVKNGFSDNALRITWWWRVQK